MAEGQFRWHLAPLGEAALLAEALPTEGANGAVLALASALRTAPLPGIESLVPAINTLLVTFDPLRLPRPLLEAHLHEVLATLSTAGAREGRLVEVPVLFGGSAGLDLPEVAETLGSTVAAVIAELCDQPWPVLMLGFAPGFPYLGPLPPHLTLPRRATPRARVPAGAVAIAAGMAGIYPAALPGGWHLIGQTDLPLFDPTRHPPATLQAGDRVHFRPCQPSASSR